jgi:hypothetical protein
MEGSNPEDDENNKNSDGTKAGLFMKYKVDSDDLYIDMSHAITSNSKKYYKEVYFSHRHEFIKNEKLNGEFECVDCLLKLRKYQKSLKYYAYVYQNFQKNILIKDENGLKNGLISENASFKINSECQFNMDMFNYFEINFLNEQADDNEYSFVLKL